MKCWSNGSYKPHNTFLLAHTYTSTLTQQHNLVKNQMQNCMGDEWLNNYLVITYIEILLLVLRMRKSFYIYIYMCVCVCGRARVCDAPLSKISESVTALLYLRGAL